MLWAKSFSAFSRLNISIYRCVCVIYRIYSSVWKLIYISRCTNTFDALLRRPNWLNFVHHSQPYTKLFASGGFVFRRFIYGNQYSEWSKLIKNINFLKDARDESVWSIVETERLAWIVCVVFALSKPTRLFLCFPWGTATNWIKIIKRDKCSAHTHTKQKFIIYSEYMYI